MTLCVCANIDNKEIKAAVTDNVHEMAHLEVSGDCFRLAGVVSMVNVVKSDLATHSLEMKLNNLELPAYAVDCVRGTWTCCARLIQSGESYNLGEGLSNSGLVAKVVFACNTLKLSIRNNWSALSLQSDYALDMLAFEVSGRIVPV